MSQHTEIFTLPPFNGQLVPPRYTNDERTGLTTETGSLIFNTTTEVLQVFDGTEFIDLTTHRTYLTGLSATTGLGSVTVSTP